MKLLLLDNYHCILPHNTRSQSDICCTCRWCCLARMNGLELRRWQSELKSRSTHPDNSLICSKCGKGLPISQKSHQCSSSDISTVSKMLQAIPDTLKPKLAYSIIKELQEENSSVSVKVTPTSGGKAVPINIGTIPTSEMKVLTHKEVITMSSKCHLSGEQQASVVADIRSKWGRKVVESGLDKEMPLHNQQFASLYTTERKNFMSSNNVATPKHLFFCHDPVALISKIKELRKI